jgi:hypothetical protein
MPDEVHPTRNELRGALLDEVSERRGRQIAEHLDSGCEECALTMLAELGGFLYGHSDLPEPWEDAPEPSNPSDSSNPSDTTLERDGLYDQAIDRALESSLRLARRIQRERVRIPAALRLLTEQGADTFLRHVPRGLGGLAGLEALLARSREIRAGGPSPVAAAAAVRLARSAVEWSGRLSVRRYGLRQVRDLQCRAWLELGEAERQAENPAVARTALAEAARLFDEGSGDEEIAARLLAAQEPRRARGAERAGHALIRRGAAAVHAGRAEEAVRLLGQGIALLDREREADLVLPAVHTLLHALVALGRFRETRAVLFEYRSAFQAAYRRSLN